MHVAANCPVWGFGECHAEIVVQVPAQTSVTVKSASGDIVASGLGNGGDLETVLRATSRWTAAPATSRWRARSGDVVARGLRSNMAMAKTASGDVDLRFAIAPKARRGAHRLRRRAHPRPAGHRGLQRERGDQQRRDDIGVRQDPDSTRFLRVETSSGDAVVDYGG